MGFNLMFWLFLAATVVASLTFVTIVVWAENRLKERQEFYRFEFRKRLIEAGKMDTAGAASLVRYEHELGLRQGRQKLLVAALVFVGLGVGGSPLHPRIGKPAGGNGLRDRRAAGPPAPGRCRSSLSAPPTPWHLPGADVSTIGKIQGDVAGP